MNLQDFRLLSKKIFPTATRKNYPNKCANHNTTSMKKQGNATPPKDLNSSTNELKDTEISKRPDEEVKMSSDLTEDAKKHVSSIQDLGKKVGNIGRSQQNGWENQPQG